jgi:DNA-binding transcriptional ArsR family regulator
VTGWVPFSIEFLIKISIFVLANILILCHVYSGWSIFVPETLRQFKASIFQALAHPTRIAIIEILRDGELPAGAIIERLGLEQANASQHLSVLRAKQIVSSRKEGNQVFYSVRDPLLIEVLDVMRRYFQAHVEEAISMLKEIDRSDKESS